MGGSGGSDVLLCFGFVLFILVCAVTVLIHRASHYFASAKSDPELGDRDRKLPLERLRAQLNKLSDEQRARLCSLTKSGREVEAIGEAERLLAVSVDDATLIVDELQRDMPQAKG
jgi:hypothetical protein